MNITPQLDLCRAYLYATAKVKSDPVRHGKAAGPVVTISREAGARGNSIAAALVGELESDSVIPKYQPWTLFNQNLVEHIIREHNLPERTGDYFPEDKPEEIKTLIAELCGLHSGADTNIRKTAETIRSLANAGNVIIVGRGGNLITADIRHSLHVRLVGSLDSRVVHYAKTRGLTRKDAVDKIARVDLARKRYIKAHFHLDIAEPHHYDLFINTDRFSNEHAARVIRHALETKFD
jgi:cytidylate kinase